MYRGDPPQKHISPLPPEMEKEVHSSLYHCQILKLAIRGNAPDGALKIKIKHETMKVAELSLFHEQQKGVSEHNVTDLGLIFSLHDQVSIFRILLVFSSNFVHFWYVSVAFSKGLTVGWAWEPLCQQTLMLSERGAQAYGARSDKKEERTMV
ncbi:uncharacterized protein LOC125026199 [Penaeus chinensis]|uniref:uncharacterized protein LOC125026199 n=1 Tax=Penaeus chinensis TaxID=139456 RepID=UPI001FB73392|nr:uncharacterized protein LOC125026199 [Penaeus chinensis]